MKINNQKKVNYKQARSFTPKELQQILNSFKVKPPAQGLIDFLTTNILEGREKL